MFPSAPSSSSAITFSRSPSAAALCSGASPVNVSWSLIPMARFTLDSSPRRVASSSASRRRVTVARAR
jgi:hypothetical protein